MPVRLSVSTTGLSQAKGKAVSWVFNSHGSDIDIPLRNLSLIAPTPADTQVLLGPGSCYIPFLLFSGNGEYPNCPHHNEAKRFSFVV